MDNSKEVQRLFKEAQEDLLRSKKTFEINDFVDAVHNAQLSIEKSAKSVIAFFKSYKWTHDPSDQIEELINENKLPKEFKKMAENVKFAAPWHIYATYGKREKDKIISPGEICTKEIAEELIKRAEENLNLAEKFLRKTDERME